MEVNAQDIIDSVDLGRSEVLLPIYESIVNSIISLEKTEQDDKNIEVIIERLPDKNEQLNLFGKNPAIIKSVTIIDNGEGFTEENFSSFKKPFSKVNKKYGCKGIGRFTILALFERMDIISIFQENDQWYRRSFSFDAKHEIYNESIESLTGEHKLQTKVTLVDCKNKQLMPYTAKNAEDIAKGIMDHCFIYYLSGNLPHISVGEINAEGKWESLSVNNYFELESKDKEKDFFIKKEAFKLYVVKTDQVSNRKYNYVSFCANSRKVGGKRELSKVDSLYAYPITENGKSKYIDVYVVSSYLDAHVNNQRTGFKIPESNNDVLFSDDLDISIEEIMRAVAKEVASLYQSYAIETQKRNIREVKEYITKSAPQYRSFIYRKDVLEAIPPNLSDEKKDEYLHKIAYQENQKVEEKIDKFINQKEVTDYAIKEIVASIKDKTGYDSDKLAEYVFRRKAIIRLFEKMLDQNENGRYETESMIHNLIFPMGLTNRELEYQYHNLWLLDDRFSTFRFIASDKPITSWSQIKSSKEPDIILINREKDLIDNAISFGSQDSGTIGTMVIFEFKRPGDTAHQKSTKDYRWDFSVLVEKYFDDFQIGEEKKKENYRGNIVKVTRDTPNFGYVIMDKIPDPLADFNVSHGWRKTPFGSFYKINPDQNLHIEAITYQGLIKNAKERNNPFFDALFAKTNIV